MCFFVPKELSSGNVKTEKNWQRLATGKFLVGIALGWGKSLNEGRLVRLMTYLLQGDRGLQSERRHCNAEKRWAEESGWQRLQGLCVWKHWKAEDIQQELCALDQPRPDTMGQAHTALHLWPHGTLKIHVMKVEERGNSLVFYPLLWSIVCFLKKKIKALKSQINPDKL